MASPTVSVIIPTLNAGREIGPLLERLLSQTLVPLEILVVDSSSDDRTVEEVERVISSGSGSRVRLIGIERSSFDHGGTRRMAAGLTSGEFIMLLTQDAVPLNETFVERLVAPFSDERVAISTGRQVPKADAVRYEQLVREFNYPKESYVRSSADLERCGIKTYFTSDVCCAYRRSAYEELGGFPESCNTSEDMFLAIRAIEGGWSIAYAADAMVLHSHNLTFAQQYRRNREVGYFLQVQHAALDGISETGEGARLVKKVSARLLSEGRFWQLVRFFVDCSARLLGNRRGRAIAKKEMERA